MEDKKKFIKSRNLTPFVEELVCAGWPVEKAIDYVYECTAWPRFQAKISERSITRR